MPSVVEVKNLGVVLGGNQILRDVSFTAKEGESVVILGPNGSGKTTLFRAILGAISYQGEIRLAAKARIGYVPQRMDFERTLPLNVREFWELQPKGREDAYSSEELLSILGLPKDFSKKPLAELSSGEFQRALIGFAIKNKPNLLLFDEPAAGVDIAGQENLYELLHRLQDTYRLTLLLISHDLSVVYAYANKVLCLNHRQLCFGAPQEVLSEKTLEQLYGKVKLYSHKY